MKGMVTSNEERIRQLKEASYQETFGVRKQVFDRMFTVLVEAHSVLHSKGGKPAKLTVLDKLVITLDYYKDYRPMNRIAFDYSVTKNAISKSVSWVERTLIKNGQFHLPNKRALSESNFEVILVDATESAVERPQKNSENGIPARKSDTLQRH
jgi:predicted DNA-binding protein YlxM (UPF0122 family)